MISSKDIYQRASVLRYVIVRSILCPPFNVLTQMQETGVADSDFYNKLREIFASLEKEMKDLGLLGGLTQTEKSWFKLPIDDFSKYPLIASHWRKESLGMLLWALGIWEDPEVDGEITEEQFKTFTPKKVGLFETVPMLDPKIISRQRERYELWHWRVRTQKLIDENFEFKPNEAMLAQGLDSLDSIVRMTAKSSASDESLKLKVLEEDFQFLSKPFRNLDSDERSIATSIIMERHFALNWMCGYSKGNSWDDTPTET